MDEEGPSAAPGAGQDTQQQQVEGQQQQAQQQQKPRLPPLPRQEDDGRLPAYAVAFEGGPLGGDGGHGGGRPGRKSDHADEEPPPGVQPTDVFIGALR